MIKVSAGLVSSKGCEGRSCSSFLSLVYRWPSSLCLYGIFLLHLSPILPYKLALSTINNNNKQKTQYIKNTLARKGSKWPNTALQRVLGVCPTRAWASVSEPAIRQFPVRFH